MQTDQTDIEKMGADRAQGVAPLALDPDRYRAHLEGLDLTREQQDELLATLWNIMRTFVDLGFGLDSVQVVSHLMGESQSANKEEQSETEDKDV